MDTDVLEAPEIKAIGNSTIRIDEAKGIIEAFVAAVGNKDSVDDIIIPGAFTSSLLRRKPRVVWGHNWNEPIGKVLEITEVPPTDDRLPQKMKNAGVGGLYAKVQFNLASERGREAFATVLFFGEEQEWSIGYKTITKEYDPIKKANILREVELYEVSPVLHGANNLTGTISVKSEEGHDMELVYTANEDDDETEGKIHGGNRPSGTYDFEDDKGEEKMQRLIRAAINGVFGKTTKINFMDNYQIVFVRPDGTMWLTSYRVNYPRVAFTPPRRARLRTVAEPLPNPAMVGTPAPLERATHHDEDETYKGADNDINLSSSGNNLHIWNNTVTGTTSATDWTFITDGSDQFSKGWDWEETEDEDEENEQEKVGRVLNKNNMRRLEEALAVIEEVLASGVLDGGDDEEEEPVKPEKSDGGVLFKAYKAKSAESENDFVVGRPETLNGTSIEIPVENRERADEVLLALEDEIVALDLAVVAPGEQSFEEGPSKVSVYLSSNDDLRNQIQALATALSQVKGDFDLSVERTEPQSFSEVFTAGKV